MFSFFKKNKSPIDFSAFHCDMHSHLIPGIDDGSPDFATSIQLIKGMMGLGFKKIITTPHIMWDMYKNTAEIILPKYEELKNELRKNKVEIAFQVAAEYFLDDYFEKLVDSNTPLLCIKDKMVLVEFSFVQEPIELKSLLFKLQINGYQPIIAHPERYLYFGAKKFWYDEMKDIGCHFQLNVLSLGGFYGKAPVELSQYLIKKNYINLIGTDLHHAGHLEMLANSPIYFPTIKALLDSGKLLNPQL